MEPKAQPTLTVKSKHNIILTTKSSSFYKVQADKKKKKKAHNKNMVRVLWGFCLNICFMATWKPGIIYSLFQIYSSSLKLLISREQVDFVQLIALLSFFLFVFLSFFLSIKRVKFCWYISENAWYIIPLLDTLNFQLHKGCILIM